MCFSAGTVCLWTHKACPDRHLPCNRYSTRQQQGNMHACMYACSAMQPTRVRRYIRTYAKTHAANKQSLIHFTAPHLTYQGSLYTQNRCSSRGVAHTCERRKARQQDRIDEFCTGAFSQHESRNKQNEDGVSDGGAHVHPCQPSALLPLKASPALHGKVSFRSSG